VVEYEHALGKVALLRRIFNVGPFEVSGSNEVINNQMFDYTNESKHVVKRALSTSYRFSDIENSWYLPTGQSGNPFGTHNDQAEIYNAGNFRKMMLNKEIIKLRQN
jgi:penicillin amidase